MRPMMIRLVPILTLLAVTLPGPAWADHEITDERPATPFPEFHDSVRYWIDPWLANSETDLADDHAPLVAYSLYEALLGIKPESCYWDTYAAYWAVAADIRSFGWATSRDGQQVALERVLVDLAHAEDLARDDQVAPTDEGGCASTQAEAVEDLDPEAKADPGRPTGDEAGSARVIEIEVTAALQYTDEQGDRLAHVAVTPGETVLFRLHNTAGFEHSFYIGSVQELAEPAGATDTGIADWYEGVRELEWTVPADVSGLLYGCTVPGHFHSEHGMFSVTSPGTGTASDARPYAPR